MDWLGRKTSKQKKKHHTAVTLEVKGHGLMQDDFVFILIYESLIVFYSGVLKINK